MAGKVWTPSLKSRSGFCRICSRPFLAMERPNFPAPNAAPPFAEGKAKKTAHGFGAAPTIQTAKPHCRIKTANPASPAPTPPLRNTNARIARSPCASSRGQKASFLAAQATRTANAHFQWAQMASPISTTNQFRGKNNENFIHIIAHAGGFMPLFRFFLPGYSGKRQWRNAVQK